MGVINDFINDGRRKDLREEFPKKELLYLVYFLVLFTERSPLSPSFTVIRKSRKRLQRETRLKRLCESNGNAIDYW